VNVATIELPFLGLTLTFAFLILPMAAFRDAGLLLLLLRETKDELIVFLGRVRLRSDGVVADRTANRWHVRP